MPTLSELLAAFLRKFLHSVVETAFHVSIGTLSEELSFLKKIISSISDIDQKTCGSFQKFDWLGQNCFRRFQKNPLC